MLTFIQAYIEGFAKHYPDKNVEVKAKRQPDGSRKYAVVIGGDTGGILLSENDMRDATRLFNK